VSNDTFGEHRLAITDALQRLNAEIVAMRKEAHDGRVESRERFASLEVRVEKLDESVKSSDALRTEVIRLQGSVATLENAKADTETRLRAVEATRSQALAYAALAAIVVSALVAAIMRGIR
jgi:hypothetical protein